MFINTQFSSRKMNYRYILPAILKLITMRKRREDRIRSFLQGYFIFKEFINWIDQLDKTVQRQVHLPLPCYDFKPVVHYPWNLNQTRVTVRQVHNFHNRTSGIVYSQPVTGSQQILKIFFHRNVMIYDYQQFLFHEGELQPSIHTKSDLKINSRLLYCISLY